MRRGKTRPLIVAVVTVGIKGSGFETAESYCGDFYRDGGGGTPSWAREDDLFSDYASCVEWYEDVEGQVQ